jgi:HD-GYP domain-containing protein (c-di-GMP phosphodiesterase class II)
LIALNKHDSLALLGTGSSRSSSGSCASVEAAFRRTDAVLLLPFAALLGLHLRAARQHIKSRETVVGLTRALALAIDRRDALTAGHSERVARIAVELARDIGLRDDDLSDVYLSGLLHDLGKIGLSDAILRTREPLSTGEPTDKREEAAIASRMIASLHSIAHLFPAVRHHQEHYDGSGYPDGLKGDAIPLVARILAVAERYDTMTTVGPDPHKTSHAAAREVISRGAGVQWDGRVIEALLRCHEQIRTVQERCLDEANQSALHLRHGETATNPDPGADATGGMSVALP